MINIIWIQEHAKMLWINVYMFAVMQVQIPVILKIYIQLLLIPVLAVQRQPVHVTEFIFPGSTMECTLRNLWSLHHGHV